MRGMDTRQEDERVSGVRLFHFVSLGKCHLRETRSSRTERNKPNDWRR